MQQFPGHLFKVDWAFLVPQRVHSVSNAKMLACVLRIAVAANPQIRF